VKTDNIKSGNVSPKIPKSLPLKREKFFPLIFSDYRVKCGIWDQKLKSMISGSNMEIGKKAEPFLTLP